MVFRKKIGFIIIGILIQSMFSGDGRAEGVPPKDNSSGQEIVSGARQRQMTLVSLEPWVVEGAVLGSVAAYVYDDVSSGRPADYWEIYNQDGGLLAVAWFDSLGMRKTAVDRGIVEEKDELEGVFVVVLDGDPT